MSQASLFWAHLLSAFFSFYTSALALFSENYLIMNFKCSHYLLIALPLLTAGLGADDSDGHRQGLIACCSWNHTRSGLERGLEVTRLIPLTLDMGKLRPRGEKVITEQMFITNVSVPGAGDRVTSGSAMAPVPTESSFYWGRWR